MFVVASRAAASRKVKCARCHRINAHTLASDRRYGDCSLSRKFPRAWVVTLSVFVYIDGRNTQQCFFERAALAFGVFKCAEESMMIATTVIIYYSYYWRDGMPHCYSLCQCTTMKV